MSFYTNVFVKNSRLFVRGYDNNLEPFADIIKDYKPYIFIPDASGNYHTINGRPCRKFEFTNLKAAYESLKRRRETENDEHYGMTNFVYTYINDTWPGRVQFNDRAMSIVSIDIEVASRNGFPDLQKADEEVTAITLVKNGKSITFGCKEFYPKNPRSEYVQCNDEKDLLLKFLSIWNSPDWTPDIITGWSADLFDIPYLVRRITNILGESAAKRLSPFNYVEEREIIRAKDTTYKSFDDRKDKVYELYGITTLDYLQLYKKFNPIKQESYALNNIANVELKKEKVKYSGSLDDLYDNDPQTFFEYNIEDAFLVSELESKKKFIQFVTALAYEAKVNFIDAMTTLRPWDVIIHNYLLEKKIVIPQYHKKLSREILGGYVKNDPEKVGLHHWVVSFDFESLYPTIISQHNISAETLVDKLPATDPKHIVERDIWPSIDPQYSYCANGTRYRKDIRGFIPDVIDLYMKKRKDLKDEMKRLAKEDKKKNAAQIAILDNQQQAVKILNNGLYGALTMEYFRWYDANLGEAVTYTSQVCTRYIEKNLNAWFNKTLETKGVDYIIAADTDSIYFSLTPILDKLNLHMTSPEMVDLIDKICKQRIQPKIAGWCKELTDKFNVYKPKLNMKQEAIAEKVIWRAPKMYAMNVWDMEGIRNTEPELKVKGIEIVRSSTPMLCRTKLKEALSIIMNKNETTLQEYIEKFKEEYFKLPFEVIANPRSVDGLVDYYDPDTICKKGTPIHVRGALIYNHAIKTLGLEKKYQPIKDKSKIRFMYLKEPNEFGSHVIAAPDALPEEFELEQYLDKQLQFEKTFIHPIKSICDLIGWKTVKINDLKAFL